MTPHTRWALWTVTTLATFTALETHALRHHQPSGTLTEATRHLLGVTPKHPRRWLLIPTFAAFLGWILVHILSEPVHTDPWER